MGVHRQLPHLSDAGMGVHRQLQDLIAYMQQLADRLRHVRVCCGDWKRVCTPAVTMRHGVTGILLDPPYAYDVEAGRDRDLYSHDDGQVSHAVRDFAVEIGKDRRARVALCGYDGEHALPDGWECVQWKAHGGMGNQSNGRGRDNAERECIWFSPYCLRAHLFSELMGTAMRDADEDAERYLNTQP